MPMFDFGASAFNIGLQEFHNRRARKWQEEQVTKQYQRGIEQRDYQNWYNSPVEQMSRFEKAGLNPHLIYGKGTPGQQTQTPKVERPTEFGKMGNLATIDPLGELNKLARIKNTQAQTDLTNQHVLGKELTNRIMLNTIDSQIAFYEAKLDKKNKEILTEEQKALYTSQLKELAIQKTRYHKALADFAEDGVFQSDPMWQRQISRFAEYIWDGVKQASEYVPRIQGGINQGNPNSKFYR